MPKNSKKFEVSNSTAGMIIVVAAYLGSVITTLIMTNGANNFLARIGFVFLSVLTFMTCMYVVARIAKRTDVVDIAWGLAFIVAAYSALVARGDFLVFGWNIQTVTMLLVSVWGFRLAYYIGRRVLSHPEDKRYIALRNEWKGNVALNTYSRIFVGQALLATLVSTAVVVINTSHTFNINVFTFVGVVIWLIGFLFEALGDSQLKKHLANPKNKGKLMTEGVWKYTRHPNYFGEATMWWGIGVIALGVPFGWIGLITPLLITYLLVFVSGVPMTEKHFEGRKGWDEYKKRTSIFLPLPPKE